MILLKLLIIYNIQETKFKNNSMAFVKFRYSHVSSKVKNFTNEWLSITS